MKPTSKHNISISSSSSEIHFPKGYYFKPGNANTENKIEDSRIHEINLNTFPPFFVIENKEVIFVEHSLKKQLRESGNHNDVDIINRFDIWSSLNATLILNSVMPKRRTKSKC